MLDEEFLVGFGMRKAAWVVVWSLLRGFARRGVVFERGGGDGRAQLGERLLDRGCQGRERGLGGGGLGGHV